MNHLLADTLRFLQENFEDNTTWSVKADQMHLKEKQPSTLNSPAKLISPQKTLPPSPSIQKNPVSKFTAKVIAETPIEVLSLDPPKPIIPDSPLKVEFLSSAVKELFPLFATNPQPPSDKDLRVNPVYKRVLKSEVILFSFREGKETDLFLQNISLAINSHFCSSTVFDVRKWETSGESFDLLFKQSEAKLLICSEALYKQSSLLPFLKEIPSSSQKFLGSRKLILLQPFDNYFNNPLLKKELWKNLCATLSKITPSQESS
jgi:hypothetical protein